MAGGIKVRVDGLSDLKKALDEMKMSTAKGVLRRAGIKALQPMAEDARRNAPVLTGELKASIAVSAKAASGDAGRQAFGKVLRAGGTRGEAQAALRDARRAAQGARGDYFVDLFMGPEKGADRDEAIKQIAQEFGTTFHEPQPYMRPAFDAHKRSTIDRVAETLREEIDKTVERAARRAARQAATGG